MKKFFALFVCICVFMSSVSVYALSSEDLLREYNSMEIKASSSLRLNQPLKVLDNLSYDDGATRGIMEGLLSSSSEDTCRFSLSEDNKKFSMYLESTDFIPINIGENLKLDIKTKSKLWIQGDFSDSQAPVIKFVMLMPTEKKYLYVDNIFEWDEIKDEDDPVFNVIKAIAIKLTDKEFRKAVKEIVLNNSTVTTMRKYIEIVVSGEQIKTIICQIADNLYKSGAFKGVDDAVLEKVKSDIMAFPLGDNTAVKCKYVFENDMIKSSETHIDIELDVMNLTSYGDMMMGVNNPVIMLGKEEDRVISFGISIKCDYTNVNGDTVIEMPLLTEENSRDLTKNQYSEWIPEFYEHPTYYIKSDTYSDNQEDIRFKIEDITESIGMFYFDDEMVKNGSVTIEKGWWRDKLVIKENCDHILLGEAQVNLSEPVGDFEQGLSVKQIEEIFGLKYEGMSEYDYMESEANYRFSNPLYVEPEYDGYTNEWYACCVNAEGRLPVEKEKMELDFNSVTEGFAIEETSLVNANGNIQFMFYDKTITFTPGSDKVIVNGDIVNLDKAVRESDGKYIVGCDFVEKVFNCRLEWLSYDGETTILRFENNNTSNDW